VRVCVCREEEILFVCLFFTHFHTIAPIWTKLDMKVEDLPGEVLNFGNMHGGRIQAPIASSVRKALGSLLGSVRYRLLMAVAVRKNV
jgi:hypothetical protein